MTSHICGRNTIAIL